MSAHYVCRECDAEFPKWHGRCKQCGEWNALEAIEPEDDGGHGASDKGLDGGGGLQEARSGWQTASSEGIRRLGEVDGERADRMPTGIAELDRVLGGGLVPGGAILLGGDPGIGKSTLSLQLAGRLSRQGHRPLYFSGEESLSQLKMRAERLEADTGDVAVVGETNLERTEQMLREEEPDLVVVDSIQTMTSEELSSSPGSVVQLKESTGRLTQLAKGLGFPLVLIGHVTKQGAIAGPKVLEHVVDTVLYFEGRSGAEHRVLRAVKNRYGSTDEIGVFAMTDAGLEEVDNPSAKFLEERPDHASGSAVAPVVEGTRPLLVEVQGLVSPTQYGPPQVTAEGVDKNRAVLLLNIVEQRTGLEVTGHDVFVNVAGGVELDEPAADLAMLAAMLSSYLDRPLDSETVVFGEVGLTGEVRAVPNADQRLVEAANLGFNEAVLPRGSADDLDDTNDDLPASFHRQPARTLADAIRLLFGDDVLGP